MLVGGDRAVIGHVAGGGAATAGGQRRVGDQQEADPVEVEPGPPPVDRVMIAGPGVSLRPTTKVSMMLEPPSSTTRTRASFVNWICRGTRAPVLSGRTEPGIGRSPPPVSEKPAIVSKPALST